MSDDQGWPDSGEGWTSSPEDGGAWGQQPPSDDQPPPFGPSDQQSGPPQGFGQPPGWGQQPQGWGQQPPGWGQQPPPDQPQQPQGWGQQPPGWGQQPPPGWGQGQPQQPWSSGQPPFGQQPPSSGNRTGLIIAGVIGGVVLLIGIAVFAVFAFIGDTVETVVDSGVFEDGGQFDFDQETTLGIPEGPRVLDERGQVAGDSQTFSFTIERAATVQVDVLGEDGFDPTTTLRDATGGVVAENDDGGDFLDSQLVQQLEPGRYEVEVEGFASSSGSFQVIVTTR